MALNPGTIIKGYEIKETIGTGAMSTVYLAKRKNRSYAVKELRADFSSSEEEKILINAFQGKQTFSTAWNIPAFRDYIRILSITAVPIWLWNILKVKVWKR